MKIVSIEYANYFPFEEGGFIVRCVYKINGKGSIKRITDWCQVNNENTARLIVACINRQTGSIHEDVLNLAPVNEPSILPE